MEQIYIKQWIVYIFLLKLLFNILDCGFPFSFTLFIATSWENLSLSFDFSKGVVSSLKLPKAIYHQQSEMNIIMNRTYKQYYFTEKHTT